MMPSISALRAPVDSVRLRIQWEKGKWFLLKTTNVGEMRHAPSDDLPKIDKDTGLAGFWVELQDERGEPLFRRTMRDPTHQTIEVFDRGRPYRLRSKRPSVTIDIAVPNLAAARLLSIFGQQRGIGERLQRAIELARLSFPRKDDGEAE